MRVAVPALLVAFVLASHAPAWAQVGDDSDLAQKLQNPVADLISLPSQFNVDGSYGVRDANRFTLNIQPVVPIGITEGWNVISRTILPVIQHESPAPGIDSAFGLGDTVQSFFFSPKQPLRGWILGGGPVFLLPTGTASEIRSEQFGLGPTFVVLRQQGGWTFGGLFNHIWGVADYGDDERVDTTFFQPFVSYTFPTATSIGLNTEASYDYVDDELTLPINLFAGQLLKLGAQPINLQVGGRYYADSPPRGPEWGARFALTFLFPK